MSGVVAQTTMKIRRKTIEAATGNAVDAEKRFSSVVPIIGLDTRDRTGETIDPVRN